MGNWASKTPRLRSVFSPTLSYNVSPAEVGPVDVCMICQDSFFPYSSDGCRPVRMTCGHLIGSVCLKAWLSEKPETCPFFNHKLPATTQARYDDFEGWYSRFLEIVYLSPDFMTFDFCTTEFAAGLYPNEVIGPLHALRRNEFDEPQCKILFKCICKAYLKIQLYAFVIYYLLPRALACMDGFKPGPRITARNILLPQESEWSNFKGTFLEIFVYCGISYLLLRYAVRKSRSNRGGRAVLIETEDSPWVPIWSRDR